MSEFLKVKLMSEPPIIHDPGRTCLAKPFIIIFKNHDSWANIDVVSVALRWVPRSGRVGTTYIWYVNCGEYILD